MVIEYGLAGRIVVHGIDGEVAPHRIFMLLTEGIVAQHAAMLILGRGLGGRAAEGGDFQQILAEHHMHDLEAPADDEGAAKQALDLFGRGIGGDVKIFWLHAQQQVAYRTADDKRLEAIFLQGLGDADRIGREQFRIDTVLFGTQYAGLVIGAVLAFFAAEYFSDKFFDHCRLNRCRVGQPWVLAWALSLAFGLVATGCVTIDSKGMSFCESL